MSISDSIGIDVNGPREVGQIGGAADRQNQVLKLISKLAPNAYTAGSWLDSGGHEDAAFGTTTPLAQANFNTTAEGEKFYKKFVAALQKAVKAEGDQPLTQEQIDGLITRKTTNFNGDNVSTVSINVDAFNKMEWDRGPKAKDLSQAIGDNFRSPGAEPTHAPRYGNHHRMRAQYGVPDHHPTLSTNAPAADRIQAGDNYTFANLRVSQTLARPSLGGGP